jgi:hypothetical protein
MRKLLVLLTLSLVCTTSLLRAQEDCTMTEADLKPIVDRFNPFFTDHSWDPETQTETARLDPFRLLIIRQKACIRHHILFSLHIDPSVIQDNERFWITEALVMMKRVYFYDTEYILFKNQFENEFIRQFLSHGVNNSFNFPINERTFICKVETGDWGAKVKVESVRYIIKGTVKRPGIPRAQDDGWLMNR